jgi:hypothetical protein
MIVGCTWVGWKLNPYGTESFFETLNQVIAPDPSTRPMINFKCDAVCILDMSRIVVDGEILRCRLSRK